MEKIAAGRHQLHHTPVQKNRQDKGWMEKCQMYFYLTFSHIHSDWNHDISINFVDSNPVHTWVVSLEVCNFHKQASPMSIKYLRPSTSGNAICIQQNLTNVPGGAPAPVLFAEQVPVEVILADKNKFFSNVCRDLSFITLKLQGCCKRRGITAQWERHKLFKNTWI